MVVSGWFAGGWFTDLFGTGSDTWSAVPYLVLTTAAIAVLVWELTTQARRGAAGRWTGTDTAIVAVLIGYAALLVAAMIFGHALRHEKTSGAAFASLYVVLAAYFGWLRRRTLARPPRTAGADATPV
ncbi:hypothetical protein ACFQFC_08165 [Amorphoplanes digitatis]|uniref:Uncharacterized protein n=1 Tax=Actinoplanes digitatis TaxID=1868 RepID=A0A7W7I0R5_9ACTN|nr:hypothetical protein [Actinoplanes digitatis]MBB4764178.1 hypothetical protein [Actinoplanes digitatis]BFE73544.1 hypothetical protein GCM10020092_068450 [Actinoplanes digitatis]